MKYLISIIGFALIIMFQSNAFSGEYDYSLSPSEQAKVSKFEQENFGRGATYADLERQVKRLLRYPNSYKHIETFLVGFDRVKSGTLKGLNINYKFIAMSNDQYNRPQKLKITATINVDTGKMWTWGVSRY